MTICNGPSTLAALGALAMLASCAGLQPAASAPGDQMVVAQADKPSGEGKVNSVDASARKINMTHGPVAALKWPGMTMDFIIAPGVDLSALKPGVKIGFTLKPGADGMYMIDAITSSQ
jgi:Cu(I)/Ag(I) efflux system periplasmic protein CusF